MHVCFAWFCLTNEFSAIKIGKTNHSAEQLADNVENVMSFLSKKIPYGGWNNVQAIYMKTSASVALPIYNNIDCQPAAKQFDKPVKQKLLDPFMRDLMKKIKLKV